MKGIAPYTHNPAERTNVGDGLRTSRVAPSPSAAYAAATSPAGRGKNAPMKVQAGTCLGSPFGGAVTVGD